MNNAIVVCCDGLSPRYLAPYGNASVPTPGLSRFAVEANLFEFTLIDDPRLPAVYSSFFSGTHAADHNSDPTRLCEELRGKGVRSVLVSDDPEVLEFGAVAAVDDLIRVPEAEVGEVDDLADSQFAEVLGSAIGWLEQATDPFLLWIHARGLYGPWDAPYEMRTQFAEEDDPDPPSQVEPPSFCDPAGLDDDVLLGWRQAYSAQVMLWDLCLRPFLEQLDERLDAERTSLIMTASRGYPLGEHGRVGHSEMALFGELVHIPLLWRFPDRDGATQRHQHLTQPADLCHSLLDWFGLLPAEPLPWSVGYRGASLLPLCRQRDYPWRDRLMVLGPDQQHAVRTASWQLVHRQSDAGAMLFAKPEDVWELNDVADRCGDEVVELRGLLDDFLHQIKQQQELMPLSSDLDV